MQLCDDLHIWFFICQADGLSESIWSKDALLDFRLEVPKLMKPAWRLGTDGSAEEARGYEITEISPSFTLHRAFIIFIFFFSKMLSLECLLLSRKFHSECVSHKQHTTNKQQRHGLMWTAVYNLPVCLPLHSGGGAAAGGAAARWFQKLENYVAVVVVGVISCQQSLWNLSPV